MTKRFFKQIFYGFIFTLIIIGLIYFFYKVFYSQPSCFDKKQNQGEEGIDCGGPCAKICLPQNFRDIEINWVKFLKINNKIILLAQIQNPNSEIAASYFDYKFDILDSNQNITKTIFSTSFIYAEEIKYLIEFLNEKDVTNINLVKLQILNPRWAKAVDFKRPNLKIIDKKIEINSDKDFINVSGKIINNDFLVFKNINILINFYNQGIWVGSSKTIIDKISPRETREFNVIFPKKNDFNNLEYEIVFETKRT
jgi:hypothetical protein